MKKIFTIVTCFLMVFGVIGFANAIPFSDVKTNDVWFSSGGVSTYTWTFNLDTDILALGDINPGDTILSVPSPLLKITFWDDDWDLFSREYGDIYADGAFLGNFEIDDGSRTFSGGIYAAIVGDHQLSVRIDRTGGDFGVTQVELSGEYTSNSGGDTPPNPPSGTPVPEPATLLLLGSGLVGTGLLRKFKKAKD